MHPSKYGMHMVKAKRYKRSTTHSTIPFAQP